MKRTLLLMGAVAAVAAALVSTSAAGGYCSESGDVCVSVLKAKNGTVVMSISTAARYFARYQLCVKGPKSRVCKSFPIRATGDGGYGSSVSWQKNFPNQGKGVYRVKWEFAARTLTFTR